MKKFSNSKKNILISVILLIALVTSAVFTYAYFSSNVEGNENAKEQIVTTARLEILYSDGTLISKYNAMPGDHASKTFTVKNTGTDEVDYDILWKDVINNFVDKGDLFYTLTCSTDNESGECKEQVTQRQMANTTNNENIIKKIHILPDETHTYDLDLDFVYKEENQNDNQGKSITANVQIVEFTDPVITMNVENGTVDEISKTTPFGEDVTFTITPEEGYLMENINIVCNNDATWIVDGNIVTISNTILKHM